MSCPKLVTARAVTAHPSLVTARAVTAQPLTPGGAVPKPGNRQGCNRSPGVPCPSLVTARQGCNRAHDVTRNFHTCVVCLAGGQCLKLIARFPSKTCGWWWVVVVARVSFFSSYTTVQELTPARFTTILTHFLFKSFVCRGNVRSQRDVAYVFVNLFWGTGPRQMSFRPNFSRRIHFRSPN